MKKLNLTLKALLTIAGLFVLAILVRAEPVLPDVSAMSGIGRTDETVPFGMLVVKIVEKDITHGVAGVSVELWQQDKKLQTQVTGSDGRTSFAKLGARVDYIVKATIDGEEVVSRPLQLHTLYGSRILLAFKVPKVAQSDPQKTVDNFLTAPPLFLSGSFIALNYDDVKMGTEEIMVQELFYLSRAAWVNGVAIELPKDAKNFKYSIQDEQRKDLKKEEILSQVKGQQLVIKGTNNESARLLYISFSLSRHSTLKLMQLLPLPSEGLVIGSIGETTVTVQNIPITTHKKEGKGNLFLLPALPASVNIEVTLKNIPVHSLWPQWLIIGCLSSMLVILVGIFVKYINVSGEQE